MNVLFISSVEYNDLSSHNIYTDLLREFVKNEWNVFALSPRSDVSEPEMTSGDKYTIFRPLIIKMQKVGHLKKAISLLTIESIYKRAIDKYVGSNSLDLVLYATPPVNIVGVVEYVKRKHKAKTYLLLKDIWPDGIADLGAIKRGGLIYRYFRNLEKRLYAVSDRIGCMSPANVEYVLKHNPEVEASKVEVCPNCIEVQDVSVTAEEREQLRRKYGIPLDKKVFVYGGNLGKPQGVPFIIDCLRACQDIDDAFFFIVGSGTDYCLLDGFVKAEKPKNVRLLPSLPKDEYDHMLAACDVGLIFLDHRFTIPNFPSRLLSYMQAGLPVLACTDTATDIGKVITEGGFGWWCESNDAEGFVERVKQCLNDRFNNERQSALDVLREEYCVSDSYKVICHY